MPLDASGVWHFGPKPKKKRAKPTQYPAVAPRVLADGSWLLSIAGPPRTKKNHGESVEVATAQTKNTGRKRRLDLPSIQYREWETEARRQFLSLGLTPGALRDRCIRAPVNACAVVWRDADRGDFVGYAQAIADGLQTLGVVDDDVRIVTWWGAVMRKDAARPRMEVILTPWAGVTADAMLQRVLGYLDLLGVSPTF